MASLFRRVTNPNDKYEELKRASADARRPFDKDALLNLAFYLDEQYVEWKDDLATIQRIPRDERYRNAPRPVVNKIMHFVAQEHAFALQSKPTADVLPATDDPIDVSEAKVAKAYLDYITDETVVGFDRILSDAVHWALTCNESYLKWIYNPRLGRPDVLFCPSLDVYTDPYATNFKKCRYVIHSQFMDVEQIYDIWGKEVKPEQQDRADIQKAALLRELGQSSVVNGATVNELWMKPNRRYPDGVYCVWVSRDQLVEPDKFPYRHGRIPFTQIGQIPRPASQHYASAVKYLRSAQMELNKYHAQRIMIREHFANPKWWIDSMLELEEDPNDAPNQILRGNSQNGTLRPEIIQPTSMGGGDEGAWIVDEMMNIVGQHEVSQAQVPGRVESAKAIEMLKEADVSRNAELMNTIKTAISEGFWQVLMLAKQYVSEATIVQTYSREGVPEVKRFKADNVKEGMRIRVTMGSGLARTRAAREDQLLNYWDRGIIRDPEKMTELLELPTPEFVSEAAYDTRLAKNENLIMVKGDAITPNSWDNHAIHIREHNAFRKTHEFFLLDLEIQKKYEFHVDQHKKLMKEQLMEQIELQQMAMVAAGQGPPPGAPGSPAGGAGDQQDSPQSQAEQQTYTATQLGRNA